MICGPQFCGSFDAEGGDCKEISERVCRPWSYTGRSPRMATSHPKKDDSSIPLRKQIDEETRKANSEGKKHMYNLQISICIYIYIHTHAYVCMYMCMYTRIHMHMYVCGHMYVYAYIGMVLSSH